MCRSRGGRAAENDLGRAALPAGRPGRFQALRRFLDHVRADEHAWLARRIDIARHWRERHRANWGPAREATVASYSSSVGSRRPRTESPRMLNEVSISTVCGKFLVTLTIGAASHRPSGRHATGARPPVVTRMVP
jgi:hypothetical protein